MYMNTVRNCIMSLIIWDYIRSHLPLDVSELLQRDFLGVKHVDLLTHLVFELFLSEEYAV